MSETVALLTSMNIAFGLVNALCIAFWAGYFFGAFKGKGN